MSIHGTALEVRWLVIHLLTASQVDSETVARYGADAYIAKPFKVGQVLEMVEQLVGPR